MNRLYIFDSQISTSGCISVHAGRVRASNTPITITVQTNMSQEEANRVRNAAFNQSILHHNRICEVDNHFIEHREGHMWQVVVTSELILRSLHDEIRCRSAQGQFWLESELFSHLKRLINACTYAQTKQIALPNINPQCIFLSLNGKLKLGGFGFFVQHLFFLSPEQDSLVMDPDALQSQRFDPYSSTMRSLGVTFIAMMQLDLTVFSARDTHLEATITTMLEKCAHHYPTVYSIVRRMIATTPTGRLQFQQLSIWINSLEIDSRASDATLPAPRLGNSAVVASLDFEENKSTVPIASSSTQGCLVCRNTITDQTWHSSAPEDMYYYRRLFPRLCSLECFLKLFTGLLCSNCEDQLGIAHILNCPHGFEKIYCSTVYLSQQIFTEIQPEQPFCPYCRVSITSQDLVNKYGEHLPDKLNEVKKKALCKQQICGRCYGCHFPNYALVRFRQTSRS